MIEGTQGGQIATIWLSRGSARNALSIAHWQDLAATVADLAAGDARAVLIASREPGIFSAGADIAEFAELQRQPDRATAFREAMSAAIEGVAALPMPVIAAVDGGCFGAAVALILACDIVVAGDDARFAVPPARLGILYPPADIARLTAAIGRGHAARLLFTGDAIAADEARAIGLIHHRAPAALPLAMQFATRIRYADGQGIASLSLEIRNDLIADPAGVARWCAILTEMIAAVRNGLALNAPAAQ